jgi:hypothetical protein
MTPMIAAAVLLILTAIYLTFKASVQRVPQSIRPPA